MIAAACASVAASVLMLLAYARVVTPKAARQCVCRDCTNRRELTMLATQLHEELSAASASERAA